MIPELFFNDLCWKKTSGILATVISSNGRGPARAGDRLFFAEGRLMAGTVGGGSNEQQVLQACAALSSNRHLLDINSFLPGKLPSCGGSLRVMLERIEMNAPAALAFWQRMQELLAGSDPFLLLSSLEDSDTAPCYLLADNNGVQASSNEEGRKMELPTELWQSLMADGQCRIEELGSGPSQRRFFVQTLNQHGRLFLFGAGHVAREVAWLAERIGFQVIIVDVRAELMVPEHFPMSCSLYQEETGLFFSRDLIVDRDFLVIAGPDHPTDLTALEQAIATPARYIGVMGGKAKITSFEKHLREKGCWQSLAGRLHAPIGIPIPSRSPAEVAVSIVAELIQIRATPYK